MTAGGHEVLDEGVFVAVKTVDGTGLADDKRAVGFGVSGTDEQRIVGDLA